MFKPNGVLTFTSNSKTHLELFLEHCAVIDKIKEEAIKEYKKSLDGQVKCI